MFRSKASKGIVNISPHFPRELNQGVLINVHEYFSFSLGDPMIFPETNDRVGFDVDYFSICYLLFIIIYLFIRLFTLRDI